MIMKFRKILSIILLSVFLIMLIYTILKPHSQASTPKAESAINKNTQGVQSNSEQVIISEKTVDDLVDKAAKQKYIQDVFDSNQKLPLSNESVPLQPVDTVDQKQFSQKSNTNNIVSQRCYYNGQSYVAGDIVKTDQGWIRCTPTLVFSAEKPTVREYGSPAWTAVQ